VDLSAIWLAVGATKIDEVVVTFAKDVFTPVRVSGLEVALVLAPDVGDRVL
jgi:hypothetical protein